MSRCWKSVAIVLLALVCAESASGEDWPGFRGPAGNGITTGEAPPTTWDASENVKWKAPLPRPANGSPIVSNGRVFVTSAQDDDGHKRSLYCFDRTDGKQLWVHTVDFAKTMPTHKTNPYCGSTPAANGKVVVVWHASAGLVCLDFDGKEVWSRDLGEFEHIWGYGTSPVIYQDRVILHSGPGERIFVAAFDLQTGKTIWEVDEPQQGKNGSEREDGKYKGSWCTPIVANVDGQDQVICTMPTRVMAFDPKDGGVIWTCDGIRGPKGDLSYSSPLLNEGILVSIGGFQGPGIGMRLGGKGDLTDSHRLWRNEKNPQSIGSGVFLDGYIYRPNAGPGTIECLDPKTGEVVWTERAGTMWGSIVFVAGRCYVTDQDGKTLVFRPNPDKYEGLATNELGEPSNSTPAISDGEIFIRTFGHLYCIGE
ncbi:MAG: PQQ-binding-like beta-propeller repeat protein [Planctomycetales bacterium]|nr:PQQ-binding-like beta-propeller repeat protein [Planctomycetales bacterium]